MKTALAQKLLDARLGGHCVTRQDYPASLNEAYQIQQAINELSSCSIGGFKIGATTSQTMELLGVEEPIYGPLFDQFSYSSGVSLPIHDQHKICVETEFVIGLGRAISSINGPVSEEDIRLATAWISGGFELIGSRYAKLPEKRGLCAIADSGSNVAMVTGERLLQWQHINLAQSPVSLEINDETVASGHSGLSVAGNPLAMATWLVNHPKMRQRGLLAGEMVTCGTCTGVIPVRSGDRLIARFDDLEDVQVTLSKAD